MKRKRGVVSCVGATSVNPTGFDRKKATTVEPPQERRVFQTLLALEPIGLVLKEVTNMSKDPRDVEIAELKEKIRRLEETLTDVQSLTAVGELAGTTAHEFNNILTLTINYARMGLRRQDAETRDKAFSKILDASNRAAKIVGVVLGLARNRKPGREPLDLTTLVEDVLLLLERELTKYRISVERKFEAIPPVLANGNQIQQVLINLLVNARQASPNGGRLIVKIRPCEDIPQYVEVVIRDFGTGIPQDKLPKIFDAFYSTKQGPDETGKGGSGLGLSLCKRIVEEHAGKIRVESAVGKGSSFTIRLPIAKTTDDENAVEGEDDKETSGEDVDVKY